MRDVLPRAHQCCGNQDAVDHVAKALGLPMIFSGSGRRYDHNRAADIGTIVCRRGFDFLTQTQGATAVEFALVSPFILLMIVVLISIGYMLLMNQALDYATAKAARMIRTGQTQAAGISNASAFVNQELCPLLPSLFNCSNVIVYSQSFPTNVWVWWSYPYTVYTGYFNSTNSGLVSSGISTNHQFCPGSGSQYVYLQIQYPVNFFLSMLSGSATTYNGQQVYMIQSTAVFENEPFAAAGAC